MLIFIGGLLATLGAALQGGAVTVAMLIAGRFIAGWAIGLMSATIPVYCVCPSLESACKWWFNPTPYSWTNLDKERGCTATHSRSTC